MTVPILSVVGEAEVHQAADEAVVSFTVAEKGRSFNEAYETTQAKARKVVDQLTAIGVPREQIQQSRLQASDRGFMLFARDRKVASITTRITLSDLDLLPKVIWALNEAEIPAFGPIHLRIHDDRALRERALTLAVEDAHRAAISMAKAQGMTLGSIQSMEEIYLPTPPAQGARPMNLRVAYMSSETGGMDDRLGRPSELMPEHISLRRVVRVTFVSR
ncbi:MAG TPA: SIMPL domain-containing protein [Holophagaceae bacterium]|nr:SIMPL domain-containing protein [Holophagaceae bacterium]